MAAPGAFMGAHPSRDRAHEGDPTRPPAAPPKGNRAAPWDCDGEAYKGRNMVERVFNRMKHYRKAATRHDGPDRSEERRVGKEC